MILVFVSGILAALTGYWVQNPGGGGLLKYDLGRDVLLRLEN